jgi:hypothetical protein
VESLLDEPGADQSKSAKFPLRTGCEPRTLNQGKLLKAINLPNLPAQRDGARGGDP